MAFFRFFCFFLFFCSLVIGADGPSLPLPIRVEKINSLKMGELREFWVSLPDGYDQGSDKYPVIYMMDGEFNFNSGIIGGLRFAASMAEMPEFIIVGIKNTNRSLDIFPEELTYKDGSKDGGRANQYLAFIGDELMPFIDKNYRSDGYRLLFGTSNTGFTTAYALFHRPDLANAFVAASATLSAPPFSKDRDKVVREYKGGDKDLVLVMGEHDFPTVISHNGLLKESIAQLVPAGLKCRLAVISMAEHVPGNALLEGVRMVFKNWQKPQSPKGAVSK